VLARVSVFAGGWTLEAAESLCGEDGIEVEEVFDLLLSLVASHWWSPNPVAGPPGTTCWTPSACTHWRSFARAKKPACKGATETATAPPRLVPGVAERFEADSRSRGSLPGSTSWNASREPAGRHARVRGAAEVSEGLRWSRGYIFWDVRGQLEEGYAWLTQMLLCLTMWSQGRCAPGPFTPLATWLTTWATIRLRRLLSQSLGIARRVG